MSGMAEAPTKIPHEPHDDPRSLSELMRQLTADVTALVRCEINLAKAEVQERARIMARGIGLLAFAALLGVIVVACLVATLIAALSLVVPVWAAALIVAVVVALIAAGLVFMGVRALRTAGPPLPVETVEHAKEDVAWVKAQAKRGAE
jgi:cytochrome c biogenesis protein CcdA